MKFQAIIKTFVSTFTTIATASVLLVSAAQAECNFFTGWVDNKDGTVRDPRNGLVWKRCAEGFEFEKGVCTGKGREANLEDAKLLARQSLFLGQSDWRLPTKEEFSAVMGGYINCANNDWRNGEYAVSKAIAQRGLNDFWSSSPSADSTSGAWIVDFRNGGMGNYGRGNIPYVRLVRTTQLLGGKAALEFVREKADRIRQDSKKDRQDQLDQAQAEKVFAAFRKSLREGDDTNCGSVIEIKGKLIKVAFAVANYGNEHWVKREVILPPNYYCHYLNGRKLNGAGSD